jgi:transposase-like protein
MDKRKTYSDEFKLKVVLEALKEERTINELASEYDISPWNLKDWKKKFLENAVIAFNPEKAVSSYKEKLKEAEKKEDSLYKEIGKLTAQIEWAKKKSKEFGLGF